MKRCSQCNNVMPDDVFQCVRCGHDSSKDSPPTIVPRPIEEGRRESISQLLKRKRSTLLAILIALFMIWGLVWPAYQDHSARKQVAAAATFAEVGRRAVQLACSDGTFSSKRAPKDLGLAESEPSSYVSRVELGGVSETKIRLRLILDERYKRGWFDPLDPSSRLEGARLDFEFTCSPKKEFSSKLLRASTVKWFDVPWKLREDRD